MATWYKAGHYSHNNPIEAVDVIHETDKMVVLANKYRTSGESKSAKRSDYENFFPTWQEAYDFLVAKAQKSVNRCEAQLERARKELEEAKAITQ